MPSLLTSLLPQDKRWQGALDAWRARLGRHRPDRLWRLDERALHDLGLSRSEIASVEAELCGLAERTRCIHSL